MDEFEQPVYCPGSLDLGRCNASLAGETNGSMILTCRSVILNVNRGEEGRTPWTYRAEVWLHLRFCGECYRFVTQSAVVRTLLARVPTAAAPVSADTKALLMSKFRAWHETRSPVQGAARAPDGASDDRLGDRPAPGLPPKKRA